MRPWPGSAYPLGASYDGAGTNFAIFSEIADRVELCLFAEDGTETRVELREVHAGMRAARELGQEITWPAQYLRAGPHGAKPRRPL